MPHKAFLHKKSLLDQFRDDHKHTGVIQSMRAEHTWNNPLTRRKRTKKLNGWIKSFAGKDHIRKLSRFNAVQAHRHESVGADGVFISPLARTACRTGRDKEKQASRPIF